MTASSTGAAAAKPSSAPSASTIVSGLDALTTIFNSLAANVTTAIKEKFGDLAADLIAADDVAECVTEALALVDVPGASDALAIEKLIATGGPDAIAVIQFFMGVAGAGGLHFAPAEPGLPPGEGGYPEPANTGRAHTPLDDPAGAIGG